MIKLCVRQPTFPYSRRRNRGQGSCLAGTKAHGTACKSFATKVLPHPRFAPPPIAPVLAPAHQAVSACQSNRTSAPALRAPLLDARQYIPEISSPETRAPLPVCRAARPRQTACRMSADGTPNKPSRILTGRIRSFPLPGAYGFRSAARVHRIATGVVPLHLYEAGSGLLGMRHTSIPPRNCVAIRTFQLHDRSMSALPDRFHVNRVIQSNRAGILRTSA